MTIPEILDGIKKQRALVVGDICLDRWCTYDPATSEVSLETGIPRLGVVSTEVTVTSRSRSSRSESRSSVSATTSRRSWLTRAVRG